jgi:hypothetical protein
MFYIVLNNVLSLIYQTKTNNKYRQLNYLKYKMKVMKTQTTNFLQQISKQEVKQLTTQVKETIATDLNNHSRKTFGAVDMWNIQRQRKSFTRSRIFA